jgi:hypothetical protein
MKRIKLLEQRSKFTGVILSLHCELSTPKRHPPHFHLLRVSTNAPYNLRSSGAGVGAGIGAVE